MKDLREPTAFRVAEALGLTFVPDLGFFNADGSVAFERAGTLDAPIDMEDRRDEYRTPDKAGYVSIWIDGDVVDDTTNRYLRFNCWVKESRHVHQENSDE